MVGCDPIGSHTHTVARPRIEPGANEMELGTQKPTGITCRGCGRPVDGSSTPAFSTIRCPGCRATVVIPDRIDHIQLIRLIGNGAMGRVFEAQDLVLRRPVAVKIVGPDADGASGVKRCLDEARALAALNHPNVVQIHTIGEKDGCAYIVMELIDGGRLDEIIACEAPLDELRALRIALDVARGLQAAGGVGLVHGDVKPANILLTRQGPAKLVDFGVARFMDSQHRPMVYGTPQYVAPEVVLDRSVDHRSDQFGLGATLYHALSGCVPFAGQTAKEIVRSRIEGQVPDLRQTGAAVHDETAAVVHQMLQTEPGFRYPTYDDLIADLEASLDAVQRQPAAPSVAQLHDALRRAKPVRRRKHYKAKTTRRPLILMGLIVLILGSWVSGVLWWNAKQRASLSLRARGGDPMRWIDLTQLVDLHRDVVEGDWTRRDRALVVAGSDASRLTVPFALDGSYEVQVTVTHAGGQGHIALFLPVGERQVMVVLGRDGAGGLQWIDGQAADANGTGVVSPQLQQGRTHAIGVRVTVEGQQAHVAVQARGQPLTDWSGSWSDLRIQAPWTGLDPQSLGLGASQCEANFERVKVRRLPAAPRDQT